MTLLQICSAPPVQLNMQTLKMSFNAIFCLPSTQQGEEKRIMNSGESKWLLYYLFFSRPRILYAHIEGRLVILFSSLQSQGQGGALPLSPSI